MINQAIISKSYLMIEVKLDYTALEVILAEPETFY